MNKKVEAIVVAAIITANSISSNMCKYTFPKSMFFKGIINRNRITDNRTVRFNKGRHICFNIVDCVSNSKRPENLVNIPKGYKFYYTEDFIDNVETPSGKTSYTIVYFINKEPVYASLSKNFLTGEYDYSSPGIPIREDIKLTLNNKRR